jgi:hypothetical protein
MLPVSLGVAAAAFESRQHRRCALGCSRLFVQEHNVGRFTLLRREGSVRIGGGGERGERRAPSQLLASSHTRECSWTREQAESECSNSSLSEDCG